MYTCLFEVLYVCMFYICFLKKFESIIYVILDPNVVLLPFIAWKILLYWYAVKHQINQNSERVTSIAASRKLEITFKVNSNQTVHDLIEKS